jgi:hypothetical protein
MIPTLSQVQSYDPVWVKDAATYGRNTADVYEDTWSQAVYNLSSSGWQGQGFDNALDAHQADRSSARGHADALRSTAATAERSYEELVSMRDQLLQQVKQAQTAGYQVSEAFTVTPPPGMSPMLAAVKAPEMIQMTAQMQEGAANLGAHDALVGGQLGRFAGAPTNGHVHATDFKTDPSLPPGTQPDHPKDLKGLLGAQGIPPGMSPMHPQNLADLLGGQTPEERKTTITNMMLPPGAPPGSKPTPDRVNDFWRGVSGRIAALPDEDANVRELKTRMHRMELTKSLCSDDAWGDNITSFLAGSAGAAGGYALGRGPWAIPGGIQALTSGHRVWECIAAQADYDAAIAGESINPLPLPMKAGYP